MNILTYDNIDRVEWSRLVETSATGTWFQTSEAYGFFKSLPEQFRPFVVGIAQDAESLESSTLELRTRLRGVCVGYVTVEKNVVKQWLTRRAIIIGGPALADDASSEEVEALMKAVKNVASLQLPPKGRRATTQNPSLQGGDEGRLPSPIYIETRNFSDYSKWKGAFEKAGFEYKKHLNFHVDCRDKEAMWERLSENRKRQIRKQPTQTLPEGKAYIDVTESEIREWYEILRELYRTKVKTPLWPVEFFLEAYRQGVGKFLLVKHEGKVIGGSMVVVWKPEERLGTVYEWFECGLNAEYKEQYPSVMATWAGMQLAHEAGCARYDMMGAGEPDVPYGVRDFKSEFGGELVEHGRFLCVNKPMLYRLGKLGVKLLKAMK